MHQPKLRLDPQSRRYSSQERVRFASVTFRGQVQYPGFDAKAIEIIGSELEKCTYGKDLEAMLKPENQFRVERLLNGPSVIFGNYFHLRGESYKGVCGELAFNIGKKLVNHPELSSKYEFEFAFGRYHQYFFSGPRAHAFLLAWPKSDAALIRRHLENATLRRQSPLFESCTYFDPCPSDFPEKCLIIDPSFKVMGMQGVNEAPSEYVLTGFHSVEEYHPSDVQKQILTHKSVIIGRTSNGGYSTMVLGYLKDLIPEAVTELQDNRMLFLQIKPLDKAYNTYTAHLFTQKPFEDIKQADDLKLYLTEKRALKRYIDKILGDLSR